MEPAVSVAGACWRCGTATDALLVCPRCGSPLALPPGADLFAVLGLPRALAIDTAELEQRFHDASRAVHPDRHQTAGARERDLSLAASAAVNRAYRTLRDPAARGRYWLELHGVRLGDDNRVPKELAALVFETQEKLEELRAGERGRSDIETVLAELTERVGILAGGLDAAYAEWTAASSAAAGQTLDDLKRRLSQLAYLRTLQRDVESALGG
jgi:molecular chaperone HscB